ncbi:MAG: class I SAM-dependent methyltransferase [bacterium]
MTPPLQPSSLRQMFGDIDIYLFDQLLRGRILGSATVLDAGCGRGRNLVFMMRAGMNVFGIDESIDAIEAVRKQAAEHAPGLSAAQFSVQSVHALSFRDGTMDVVISSAVLHFARNEGHFGACVDEIWRVLAPGGLLFCRLASTIGIEDQVQQVDGRRHQLPDGSTRFLVDAPFLMQTTARLGGTLVDPLKTTVVQDMRAMTTWVLRKPSSFAQ